MDDNGPEWATMMSIVVHPDPFSKHGSLKWVVAEGYFEHVLIVRSQRLGAVWKLGQRSPQQYYLQAKEFLLLHALLHQPLK
jgi:hypothetical protein